ncbi:uncharacterized protein LOC143533450 [Bidens hawaiensis]|uniref:uncharacterized protein LOC143533450 n=1 Tax=Bidens hawaiensis TaxID=980011 RepID=UPI0040494644
MDALHEDTGDGSMQCTEHPFKNNTPAGGICAICLQQKLGKLVSSSFPIAVFPSSSSSSPSFRSDTGNNHSINNGNDHSIKTATMVSNTLITPTNTTTTTTSSSKCQRHQYHSNRSRMMYLIGQKKKKKKDHNIIIDGNEQNNRNSNILLKRSKSSATYLDDGLTSPHKHRGFWSFIHLQKHPKTHRSISSNTLTADISSNRLRASTVRSQHEREIIVVEENESPCPFDRKVSRSRSVGCGSRSFSGDFFERISTGFGDCTLRRVESHREGKSKHAAMRHSGQDCIKERVRCGGLFSGFMITSSSSSSSSSSYFVASNPKVTSSVAGTNHGEQHSRSRSWSWALASPMRAFSKPSSSSSKASNKNQTPNLAAVPSLSVRS